MIKNSASRDCYSYLFVLLGCMIIFTGVIPDKDLLHFTHHLLGYITFAFIAAAILGHLDTQSIFNNMEDDSVEKPNKTCWHERPGSPSIVDVINEMSIDSGIPMPAILHSCAR